MGAALAKFRGCDYMPLKLKGVMVRHGISQPALAAAILQTTGRPMSSTSMSFIVNWDYWPRSTPEADIRRQVESFLASHGVSPEEISTAWEPHGDEVPPQRQMPVGAHLRALDARKPYVDVPKSGKHSKRLELIAPEFEPMEIEMLSPAAKRHFKIFRDPFQDDVNSPEDVFLSEDQRYVLEAMLQTAKAGGITAVVGESGSGKTTLRKLLQHRITREGQNIRLIFPHTLDKSKMSTGNICTAIINDLEPDSTVRSSLESQARQVKDVLLRSSRAGAKHLLMIEEAHDLSIQTLKYLKRFYEIESDDGFGKVLSIVLIAQPEMKIKLDVARHPEAREFINRCEVATLMPLYENLKNYVAHKLERSGVKVESIFTDDAFEAIRSRWTKVDPASRALKNNLYPLIVNNTITRALNRAAELGLPVINGDLVKEL
jgi:type II secretory pathway predicted ATPase ExeA